MLIGIFTSRESRPAEEAKDKGEESQGHEMSS